MYVILLAARDMRCPRRSEALQLDRRRFRRLRAAAQLFACGEHAQARLAAREARAIKAAADTAHRSAATRIEHDNNLGKGKWELDLHGLHLGEANSALDRRCGRAAESCAICKYVLYLDMCFRRIKEGTR